MSAFRDGQLGELVRETAAGNDRSDASQSAEETVRSPILLRDGDDVEVHRAERLN